MDIIFTNTKNVPEEYSPKPATKSIPNWYKDLDSYMNGKKVPLNNGETAATAKRCMPIFDAIGCGYIIESPADVYITQENGSPYYQWTNYKLIDFHIKEQILNYPSGSNLEVFPKWVNPWGIKTPKGYSVLFTQPMHRDLPFTILPGVVDTDRYTAAVNFPFVLNDPNFEGMIPAGTPIAQVVPFKRDPWQMKIGDEQDLIEQAKVLNRLQSKFFDRYKNFFRVEKQYK